MHNFNNYVLKVKCIHLPAWFHNCTFLEQPKHWALMWLRQAPWNKHTKLSNITMNTSKQAFYVHLFWNN